MRAGAAAAEQHPDASMRASQRERVKVAGACICVWPQCVESLPLAALAVAPAKPPWPAGLLAKNAYIHAMLICPIVSIGSKAWTAVDGGRRRRRRRSSARVAHLLCAAMLYEATPAINEVCAPLVRL